MQNVKELRMRINEYIPVYRKYFDKDLKEKRLYPIATHRPRLTPRHLNKLQKSGFTQDRANQACYEYSNNI